jgi:hypothetical protein
VCVCVCVRARARATRSGPSTKGHLSSSHRFLFGGGLFLIGKFDIHPKYVGFEVLTVVTEEYCHLECKAVLFSSNSPTFLEEHNCLHHLG